MREVSQLQQCPAATAACTRNSNGQMPCLHGALKHVTDQGLLRQTDPVLAVNTQHIGRLA